MSKILIYADNHFCEKSSIVTQKGKYTTLRLENQLESLQWLHEQAEVHNCSQIICLGDFFDRTNLNDTEASAFMEIKWSKIPMIFIVGNHETHFHDLTFHLSSLLEHKNSKGEFDRAVINTPTKFIIDNTEICILPYIPESDRQPLVDYFGKRTDLKRIIFSHNDLAGIKMGPIISSVGFEKDEIEENCDLFINGHLHNGIWVTDKILNLGNLTGKDFGEDAFKYSHNILILDTETLNIEFIENPYAFNFYKIDINTEDDFAQLDLIKDNAVVQTKCQHELVKALKEKLENNPKIIAKRIIDSLNNIYISDEEFNVDDLALSDYENEYKKLCKAKLDNNSILEYELVEVFK